MLIAYRYLLAPLMVFLLPLAALFNRKIGAGLRLRRKNRSYPSLSEKPVWIHAASGEFEYAKSVIREIKQRRAATPVVVTYFSPTYAKNVENFPGVDFALPLPLDLGGPVHTFLKRLEPRVLLLARTDFWPEVLSQTRARGIPIHVFAYTQKENSGPLAKWRLGLIDHIHCVSPEDLNNVRALGVKTPGDVLGDTRYDQVKFRLDHPKELPAILKPTGDTPVIVAGSTWPEDEAVLLPALAPLLKAGRLKLILAPHEPTPAHLEDLKTRLIAEGIEFALFSAKAPWTNAPVLLVDQVGWLAELYAWGDMAFIGGSFRKTVHSVMEALGAGLKTFVGPKHRNNREAIEFQQVRGAVTVVHSPDDLRRAIERFSIEELREFKTELKRDFAARLGATSRLVDSVFPSGV